MGVLPGCYSGWYRCVTWGFTRGVTGVLLRVLLGVFLLTLLQVCDKLILLFVVFPSM